MPDSGTCRSVGALHSAPDFDVWDAPDRDQLALRLRPLQAPAGLPATHRPRHSDFDLNRAHVPKSVRLREAAVLVPLVERDDGVTVLLTQRSEHLTHHPGQVSFPGGRVEHSDESSTAAAVRETEEEIGITRRFLQPIGLLDDYETVTGFLVTPVVAMVQPGFDLNLDAFEVADAFEVPLRFILDPCNHQIHSRERDGVRRRFFVFEYQQHYIWGATAGMLMNLYRRLNALNGPMRPPPQAPISTPLDERRCMSQTPLHPDVARVLELVERAGNPPYHQMSAAQAREVHEERAPALDLPAARLPLVRDLSVPGAGGELAARLYCPVSAPSQLPVVLWLHGGGHTVGSITCYDSICRRLALHSGALVLSLGYRLAPEHRFPAALEDAFAALRWLSANAAGLGGDPRRLAVAGDSAGGNLAAVCALLARDHELPGLRHQLLVYPAVGAHLDYPSHALFAHGHLLTRPDIEWFRAQYLGETASAEDWRFAPLLAASHADIAPATIIVASHDPLRDEGMAYAHRLREAGIPCDLIVADGMVHAFWNMSAAVRPARRSLEDAASRLARALDLPS